MEPTLNHWTTIFLLASAQGLFLAVMLWLRKPSSKILSSIVFLFSITLLYYVAYWSNYAQYLSAWFILVLGSTYLLAPLMYLYISNAPNDKLKWRQYWPHLVPFVLYFVSFVSFPTVRNYLDPESLKIYSLSASIFQNVHLLAYAAACLFLVYKNQQSYAEESKSWSKNVALAFLGFSLSFFTYFLMVWTGTLQREYDYGVSVMMAVFIYLVGYHGYNKAPNLKPRNNKKYERSGLTEQASGVLLSQLKKYMLNEKPFLDSNLKLNQLAEKVGISHHTLSQLINEQLGQNFSDFLNSYRIEEAKTLLARPRNQGDKIIDIAYQSGFNNKVTFNTAFKKTTGLSPSSFKGRQQEESLTHPQSA